MVLKSESNQRKGFFRDVYEVVQQIPKGRVTSYGAIARYIGSGGSARMVGWALNSSIETGLDVPAHRVVNRNGLLTGKMHFEDPLAMELALETEGVAIKNDQVVEFDRVFWDPAKELAL